MTGVLIRKEIRGTHSHRMTMCGHKEKTAIYKSGREASEETNPIHTLISDF